MDRLCALLSGFHGGNSQGAGARPSHLLTGGAHAQCMMAHREVRQQTCDLITLMETAVPLSSYYLFMEDDFRCAAWSRRVPDASLAS